MVSIEKLEKIQQEENLEFLAVIGINGKRSWVKAVPDDNPIKLVLAVISATEALCDMTGMTMQEWCDMALEMHNKNIVTSLNRTGSD